jgi:hypothetical protein
MSECYVYITSKDTDGDIKMVLLSSLTHDCTITCNSGVDYNLEDITEDGELYFAGDWIEWFVKESDISIIKKFHRAKEILEIARYLYDK